MRKLRDKKMAALPEPLTHYRTTRPLHLDYVIREGRYASMARARTRQTRPSRREEPLRFPLSTAIDARSLITWARRSARESRLLGSWRAGER